MTVSLTVAQALVTFLGRQYTVDGAHRERTIAGMFGIFGHGNVAGVGQALRQANSEDPDLVPYHQGRNEQGMVHQAVGYARMRRRRGTYAATSSVGPGASNMITGAALATANRLPVLLLPSDTFATRVADPVLQQLEHPHDPGIQVTDAFRPVSRFFDRVDRPEQLPSILLAALRVLTDPAETGAVTIALPEDVQAEVIELPEDFLAPREWHLHRPLPEPGQLTRAVEAIAQAERPLLIAGGGALYAGAEHDVARFADTTRIPVATTQAGGGVLDWDHPLNLGGIGATGSTAANRTAAEADVVIGVGTRYSDFTTASRTVFQHPNVSFVNINVASFDAYKHGSGLPVIADAHAAVTALSDRLGNDQVSNDFAATVTRRKQEWDEVVDSALGRKGHAHPGQPEIIGALWEAMDPEDVLVQAAGSLPGDLQQLWRPRDPLGYHVEYGYSCMGYEIAGGLGVRRGVQTFDDDRDVVVMVGDGSYLMLHTELVTAVAEGLKLIIVLIQNQGFASIGALSETVGTDRFGTWYRHYDQQAKNFQTGAILPVDLAANARSYGIDVTEIAPEAGADTRLSEAVAAAKQSASSTLIHIHSDPLSYAPDGEGWWDVPVAEVSGLESTKTAREEYTGHKSQQRPLWG